MEHDTLLPLTLPFKGHRHYLHGSDIVPALFALTGEVEKPGFQFHRMATRPLAARRVDEATLAGLRRDGQLYVLMSYRDNQTPATVYIAVVESGLDASIARVPFDEAAIVAGARFDGNSVHHDEPAAASCIERVIALHKALLNRLVAPEPWVFSRLDLSRGPIHAHSLSISFERAMGTQVFKSQIRGDGEPLGAIYFSRSAA